MSTKIYNGHKFKNNMDLLELNERMLALRETYRKEVESYTRGLFMNLVYFYEDLYVVDPALYETEMKKFGNFFEIHSNEDYMRIIAGNVALNLSERLSEAMDSPRRNPVYDVSSSLQIFPLKDKILFTFYGNQNFEQILENEPDIEEYHYQDQCDMPEDMSEEEWEQRRIDWEQAIPSGVPAKNGFGVELVLSIDIPLGLSDWFQGNDSEKYHKTLEKRVELVAEHCYANEETLSGRKAKYTGPEYQAWLKKHKDILTKQLREAGNPVFLLYKQY